MVQIDPPHGRIWKSEITEKRALSAEMTTTVLCALNPSCPPPARRQQLRVSSYDRVSSWLVSLLIMACVTVGALVLIYFTRKFILADVSMPITPIATGGGGTGGEVGTEGGNELEAPGIEDAPAINEPQTQETLSAVASAVSTAPPFWPTNKSTSASNPSQEPAPATAALPVSAAAAAAASAVESVPAQAQVETRAPASLAAKFASSPPTSRNTANGSIFSTSSLACWVRTTRFITSII